MIEMGEEIEVPESFDYDYSNRAEGKKRSRDDVKYMDFGMVQREGGPELSERVKVGNINRKIPNPDDVTGLPFLIRYPAAIPAGRVCDDIIGNVGFAPTFLDFAGQVVPNYM